MHRSTAALLATLTLAPACMERGNGEPATVRPELGAFSKVDVGGVFVVQTEVAPGPATVELRGDSNLLPLVELRVEGGTLHASTRDNILPRLDLELVLHTPELSALELSGAARGDVTGVHGDSFELELSGASRARVAGSVKTLRLELSGASTAEAQSLIADDVDADLSGASSAEIVANASLTADASGASRLGWRGNATRIDRDATGASHIERH
ncbi:MAG: DUF2807 domain-containing protein [Nannocystaceae bacterium]|nr:DUF2807 domain-containing protein [Nannocystaceae bacterium]